MTHSKEPTLISHYLYPLTFPGIHVLITGQAETEWKEREKKEVNGSTKKSTETYKGKKLYFEQMLPLVGPLMHNEFDAGTHTFPFNYLLAENLPPSVKGVHGNCTYSVKAIFDRPWRPNETTKKEFTVATRYLFPMSMLSPAFDETMEELWSLPFKTCPFKLDVEVAQQAFRVGEGIPVNVQIEHESNVTIHELKFQLRQVIHLYSQSPTRKYKMEHNKIVDIRCKVMDSRKIGKFQRVLQIPHLPVTYLTHSELVSVTYVVRVEVKLGGLNKNPFLEVPVVIGTGLAGEGGNSSQSIGFESLMISSPPHAHRMLNMSQISSISGSTTTMSQASVSMMDSSSSFSAAMEQGSLPPPSYNDVVPSAPMMKQ